LKFQVKRIAVIQAEVAANRADLILKMIPSKKLKYFSSIEKGSSFYFNEENI
jgi:hypothetical protein